MNATAPPFVQPDDDELLEAIAVTMDLVICAAVAVRREARFRDFVALREALMVLRLEVIEALQSFNTTLDNKLSYGDPETGA